MSSKCSRRSFLEGLSSLAIGTFGGGTLLSSWNQTKKTEHVGVPELPDGATILFQGNSITDAGRNKDISDANNAQALGNGYAFLTAANLRKELYSKNVQCYNRGISGNKVFQLADRWQQDCLDLEPDVLSILIGVNDYWHSRSGNYDGTPQIYYDDFHALLERTKKALPEVKLMIGEPFVIREGSAVDNSWFPEFNQYQEMARKICEEFDAALVPYQQAFDLHSNDVDPTYWSADGVHPSLAGAELMAETWMQTFNNM